MLLRDRVDAGEQLAAALAFLAGQDPVVLGLPRGGVPVAFEVARALRAPLDVLVVRKLGHPAQPELALGAVGEGGVLVVNEQVLAHSGVGGEQLAVLAARESEQLHRFAARLRAGRSAVPLGGRVVVVVDDGIATGATARAACQVAAAAGATRVVLAVPVGALDTVASLRAEGQEVVCVHAPERFTAVGEWYADFGQTSEQEVTRLLDLARVQ